MDKSLLNYKLKVEKLNLMRSSRMILEDIAFEVKAGEALLLRGANGVGKTSLLMALAGYLHIEKSTVDWVIESKSNDEHLAIEDMHFIAHQHAIKEALSLRDNLSFWANINGEKNSDIDLALEQAGLNHAADFEAGLLSAGQKKRLSLARLLIIPKPIWLLDEPTSALDSEGDKWVASIIDKQLDRGGIVIAATHLDLPMKKHKRIKTMILGQASLEQTSLGQTNLEQTS